MTAHASSRPPNVISSASDRPARTALWVLAAGACGVVLAATTDRAFELDRFFIPKELVLHVTATIAVLVLLGARRVVSLTRVDTLLVVYLALGSLSAALAANPWLSSRALAVTISGLAIYWCARGIAEAGYGRTLLGVMGAATALAAVTSLLQAYGVQSDLFSLNRIPGGTFGNRNFVAHLATIGAPTLVFLALTARRLPSAAAMAGVALNVSQLVLSRSRAAWLALAAAAIVTTLCAWRWNGAWASRRLAIRGALVTAAACAAIAAALVLPNTLEWKSDSPYLDTVTRVMSYREGSGRGRMLQYQHSLELAWKHPALGVGPGNWAVQYPRTAPRDDPSLDQDDGMTSNPWPSSDWMAVLSERGVVAAACLALVVLGLGVGAAAGAGALPDDRDGLARLTLVATLAAMLVCGAFDVVMLLPAPALIVGAILGALTPPARSRLTIPLAPPLRALAVMLVAAFGAAISVRSALQLAAMIEYSAASTTRAVERAARADPGSYRIRIRLARDYADRGSCEKVRVHADAAHALFPGAPEPRKLLVACGFRTRR